MKKIKKTIKNTMAWATESDFRLFAVICEVCAVFFYGVGMLQRSLFFLAGDCFFVCSSVCGMGRRKSFGLFAGAADDGRRIV